LSTVALVWCLNETVKIEEGSNVPSHLVPMLSSFSKCPNYLTQKVQKLISFELRRNKNEEPQFANKIEICTT